MNQEEKQLEIVYQRSPPPSLPVLFYLFSANMRRAITTKKISSNEKQMGTSETAIFNAFPLIDI